MRLALFLPLCVSVFCLPFARADGEATLVAPYDPTQHVEMDYESGVLWRVTGSGTPLTYTLLPQIISVKGPMNGDARTFAWGVLVIRNRFSFLYEPIAIGPEHHFVGATASGVLECWNTRRNLGFFFSSGGGFGWLDSKGHQIKGAMGEDFNQLSGEDATILGYMAHGGHGCISVTSNVAPRLCSEFHAAWQKGDLATALKIHDKLMPLHTNLFIESNPAPVKYALSLLGKMDEKLRLPMVPVSELLEPTRRRFW